MKFYTSKPDCNSAGAYNHVWLDFEHPTPPSLYFQSEQQKLGIVSEEHPNSLLSEASILCPVNLQV
jgi:hypothetical protein